ncbi:MlaD family protein [Nocardia sp. GCM10030253]|uniref:MlaD family protein n=1 Tax=Nocardia sp. GCM10030253 TaxID=3273404 RepID=UPI003645B31C
MKRLLPALLAVVFLAAGCGVRASDIPIPGTYIAGNRYTITIEFGSVLNLPDRAKVVADGVDVGVLDRIDLIGDIAVATVDLRTDAQLPKSTTAELRQSTILGDIHIALQAPKNSGGPFLQNGDVIPAVQTVPATNVEDILRALSNIVTGGRWAELQDVINQLNAAYPSDPAELDRVLAGGRNALRDLAANTNDLDRILVSAASISTTLEANKSGVDRTLVSGPGRAVGLAAVILGVVDIIVHAGPLANNVSDLALPLVGDLRGIIGIITPAALTIASADNTVPMNVEKVNQLLRDKLIPFFSAPPNIRVQRVGPGGAAAAITADAEARSDQLIQVLRSIGMVR